jgi:uncharacterized caspase-like protein
MADKLMPIGVTRYKLSQADLRSCANDVENLQSALSQYSGFDGSDIVTLLDDTATRSHNARGTRRGSPSSFCRD